MADDNGAEGFLAFIVQGGRAHWKLLGGALLAVAGLAAKTYAEPDKSLVLALWKGSVAYLANPVGVSMLLFLCLGIVSLLILFTVYQRQRTTAAKGQTTTVEGQLGELISKLKAPNITHIVNPKFAWNKSRLGCTFQVKNSHPQEKLIVMRVESVVLLAKQQHISFPLDAAPHDGVIEAMGTIPFELSCELGDTAAAVVAQWREKMPVSFTLSVSLRVRRDTDNAGQAEIVTSQTTMGMPPWLLVGT